MIQGARVMRSSLPGPAELRQTVNNALIKKPKPGLREKPEWNNFKWRDEGYFLIQSAIYGKRCEKDLKGTLLLNGSI